MQITPMKNCAMREFFGLNDPAFKLRTFKEVLLMNFCGDLYHTTTWIPPAHYSGAMIFSGAYNPPECNDSEGKVERFGDWKVELTSDVADEAYEICLEDDNGEQELANVTSDDKGELKATESDGILVPSLTYVNPRLVVRTLNAGNCAGVIQFTTGMVL